MLIATRGLLKDNINFVLTKKYKLADAAVTVAAQAGMTLDTDDSTFIVSEVAQAQGVVLVYSLNIHWTNAQGLVPPPPHPEYGSPLHPQLFQHCTLVNE